MNEANERKLRSDCDNNVNQLTRSKRRRLHGPLIDVLDAREYKLEKLPSNCLQQVLSLMTYERVCQLRGVCKVFNETAIKILDKGQKDLERRLTGEIERAEKKVFFVSNVKTSYDTPQYLKCLHNAINNCTLTYSVKRDYFVAGKLLDDANWLLNDFNSLTVLPYVQERVCDQEVHPLLNDILMRSERAWLHFNNKVLDPNASEDEADVIREDRNDLKLDILIKQNEKKLLKTNLLKNRRRRIHRGNELSRNLLKLITKLNERVLDLTQWANKMGEEAERVTKGKGRLNKSQHNCLLHSSRPFGATKVMGNASQKRSNLASLPSSCIRSIVSYYNCDKIAYLRLVCKSFNEVCKQELNEEVQKLKQKFEFQIKYQEKCCIFYMFNMGTTKTNMMQDLWGLLQMCQESYKWHLGSDFYFVAGKVLDEAKRIYNDVYPIRPNDVDDDSDDDLDVAVVYHIEYDYRYRPHYNIFRLMEMTYKAIAHLKFTVVPKYFQSTQTHVYAPEFIISGDVSNLEKESLLDLEEIEKLVEEADVRIEELNDKNRKLLKIIYSLKKKVFVLNEAISEEINIMKMLEINSI